MKTIMTVIGRRRRNIRRGRGGEGGDSKIIFREWGVFLSPIYLPSLPPSLLQLSHFIYDISRTMD